jgi:hypothetical protein
MAVSQASAGAVQGCATPLNADPLGGMKRFDEIFEEVIAHWPDEIDLADAGVPALDAEGHFFPTLSAAWHEAESAFDHDPGSFESLMVWSVFGVLHRHAMELARSGVYVLRSKSVPREEYEEEYWADLHTEDWPSLLPQYERG